MTDRRVLLDTASFLDASSIEPNRIARADQKRIVETFLVCCFERVGKAPHRLDGEDLAQILREHLPASFGRKDALISRVMEVLEAFFDHLRETRALPQDFELRRALVEGAEAFERAARSRDLPRVAGPPSSPIVHRASKTGRNDPCPCGSGRKFKQCCARLGR